MALLEVDDLQVAFRTEVGPLHAVRGVSFTVEAGRTVAIVGESGSGKTVVSQALLGILPPNAAITGGAIRFADPLQPGSVVDLAPMEQDDPRRRAIRGARMSIIFQEPMSSLSPLHTIGDQIGEAYRLHQGGNAATARQRTGEMLDRVGFAQPHRAVDLYPFELSGGLRQRAMIAMALVCGPALLIADEPTTALDVTIQAQILKLMKELQAEFDMAILFITHDLGVVANIADSLVVMYRGRVMERGPTATLLRRPQHPYLQALLGAVPRLTTPADRPLTMLRPAPHRIDHLIGVTNATSVAPPAIAGPILEVEGLRKVFMTRRSGGLGGPARTIVAVDDVSFDVAPGECLAIVGESGCGKTTLSKLLMRALEPSAGQIRYRDEAGPIDVLALGGDALIAFRRKLQYMFQDPFSSLDPRMTVGEIVAEPLVIHGMGNAEERRTRVRALFEAVGLDPRQNQRFPHSFSGGQRQRIGIARALALAPRLLICDEPVSALDVSVQAQILNLLKDLQRELGLTYIFISHNLAVVRYIAQRVGVMCAGRMVELASTDAIFAAPAHPYTKALLAAVPEPDLDHLLDLERLMAGRASDPEQWPEPFRLAGETGSMRAVAQDHLVRVGT